MKTRFLQIELNSDGAPNAEELRAKMHAEIDAKIPERSRQKARDKADELLNELMKDGPFVASARSIIAALIECGETLGGLPRAVRAVAQATDSPAHVFDLGAAMGNIISAHGHIEMAKQALEGYLACDQCKPDAAPKEPEGPLS